MYIQTWRWSACVAATVLCVVVAGCSDSDDRVAAGPGQADDIDGSPAAVTLAIRQAGRYQVDPFAFDAGAAEIVAHDARLNRLFVVNSSARTVDVLDISDVDNILKIGEIDATAEGASANSVAVAGTTVAVAIENADAQAPGHVVFYNSSDLSRLGEATVGALPDMVTFTPDGQRVLVANEGEPDDDYSRDPDGSISVIDVSGGFQTPSVTTIGFQAFNDRADALRAQGVRIFGPGASVAQDLEPEYIAVADDSTTAYVSLQENNAVAVIDLASSSVTAINPLGYKDHSVAGQGIDPSNEDGFNIRSVPVFGMYQPDTIAVFEADGTRYLLTANEGDARDYDGFSEEADVKDLALDPVSFGDAEALQADAALGDLKVTRMLGASGRESADGVEFYDGLYAFGARSFSIRRADSGALVYDSGDDFERITGARYGDGFNADNTDNDGDDRSDNKGPEPEALAYGRVGSRSYAFIGFERMSGFVVYNITEPAEPSFVAYINNRDLTIEPGSGDAGDLGPESIVFIDAEDSPDRAGALLAVGNEVSGSTTLYRLETVPATGD
ncbi:choice-of-anchor I family protein [Salinisphaera sp. T31B1]|uniref:choice-of-anchor I family protein n=1 Tax=Salinisphaera sp. T31B1 TaxID=727963 RepID=UPI00334073C0